MKKSMFTLLMTGVLFVGGAVPVQADSEKYQVDEIHSGWNCFLGKRPDGN